MPFALVRQTHLLLITLVAAFAANSVHADSRTFRVEFSKASHDKPFTGRVYLIFSRNNQQPRQGPGWFNPEQFIARDVENWAPGVPLVFSGTSPNKLSGPGRLKAGPILGYPGPLSKMKLAGYRAQAVVRFNPNDREIGVGPGNGYSKVTTLGDDDSQPKVDFQVTGLVKAKPFGETDWSKLLDVPSKLLTEFHKRPISLRAAVILPASYREQPKRRYPVIFTIPGFGGTHHGGSTPRPVAERNDGGVEFLRVVLDPSCRLGHHVFADSANNGPVGKALTTELIPALNKRFRTIPRASARFLTGHSSGGWSSLWLQVTYPEVFGGTWSTAPDPVDFRDFQRINLYRSGENMYVDGQANVVRWPGSTVRYGCGTRDLPTWNGCWDMADSCTASKPSSAHGMPTESHDCCGIARQAGSIFRLPGRGRNTTSAWCSNGTGRHSAHA